MGYRSKWVEGSFEYENTSRTFEIKEEDIPLHDQIREICRKVLAGVQPEGICTGGFKGG